MAMRYTDNREAGFSLIEVMVALAILGFVLAGVVKMFTGTGGYHTEQELMLEVSQNVRAAKHLMVDEIRSAGCNSEDLIRIGFQFDNGDDRMNTDANSIHFTRDIDNGDDDEFYEPDGDATDTNEDIAYYRVDTGGNLLNPGDNTLGRLVRNTGGGGQPVAENIVDLQFRYYDAANTLLDPTTLNSFATLDQIRTVEVIVTGQVQNTVRVSTANQTWTQQFRIRVRNL